MAPVKLEAFSYVKIISPAFDPKLVLLCRVYFTNKEKSKYVLVGFYPAKNYHSLLELSGAKLLPNVLTDAYVATMAQKLPSLLAAMCRNEQYQCKSDDGVFWMNTTRSYRFVKVLLDKHSNYTIFEI